MKQSNWRCVICIIFPLILSNPVWLVAQTPRRLGPASDAEISKARVEVETHMDSFEAHRNFIYAMGMKNPDLLTQYEVWIKKYPKDISLPLFLGTVFYNASMAQPGDFLLKAARMDPKNAKIWYMLGVDADMRAQNDLLTKYMQKATLAEPSNADYAYRYLRSVQNGDKAKYKKEAFDFAKRFPEDERGKAAVVTLNRPNSDPDDRGPYYDEILALFPTQKIDWSVSTGMQETAKSLIEISKLEQDQNYKEAIARLNQLKLRKQDYLDNFIVLKKASLLEKMGDIKGAYDTLSIRFAKLPADLLQSAIESYGEKLGKDKNQVGKDIELIRNSSATVASPFELGLYTSKDTLNLNSLKGKVILLTFWFPGCAPCREEFPHFQNVINSFKNDSLVYLGINVLPSQDGYVLPFMKNTKYSFIPLRGNETFARENYNVTGEPQNFVIDKNGKIIFKDFRINSANQRTLELMLSSLLERETDKP